MAFQADLFDGVDGPAGEGAITNVPAAWSHPKMLFWVGSSVVMLAMGALVKPPKGLWFHHVLAVAYYAAVMVLFLFGVWLMYLSFVVAGNPSRRSLAVAVMWITFAPLLLVVALRVAANPNMGLRSLWS